VVLVVVVLVVVVEVVVLVVVVGSCERISNCIESVQAPIDVTVILVAKPFTDTVMPSNKSCSEAVLGIAAPPTFGVIENVLPIEEPKPLYNFTSTFIFYF
jgi:hypothetical protein